VEEKLIVWIFFSVGIALVPLAFAGLRLQTKKTPNAFSIVIARGELLLLIAALCGSSIGELIGSNESHKILKLISGGSSIIILLFSSLYFSFVSEYKTASTTQRTEENTEDGVIIRTSLILFCLAFVSCCSCVLLSKV
jgi:hypothetical protein